MVTNNEDMRDSEENRDPEQTQAGNLTSRLAEDQFYRALASVHRRRLLYHLLENGESTVEELSSVLSGWELTPGEKMSTPTDRSAIRLRLLHNHLPRLVDADLIAYDADAGIVQLESVHPRVMEVIRQSVEAEQLTPG